MSKLVTLPRLMCLTTMLAAGPALMAPDVANANGLRHYVSGHPANNARRSGIRPRFVIRGQATNIKVLSRRTDPHGQFDTNVRAAACKTNCGRPVQATTHGNPTQPTTAGNANPTTHLNGTYHTVTTSNGVTKPILNDNRSATAPKIRDVASDIYNTAKTVHQVGKTAAPSPSGGGRCRSTGSDRRRSRYGHLPHW